MMRGTRRLLALVLLAPLAAAAQETGFYEVGGIEYYYATGTLGSGHFVLGGDEAGGRQQFDACSWAKLRPDSNNGRVQVLGTWADQPLDIDISSFPDANVTPDAIDPDARVPADASGIGREWPATMLVASRATIDLGNALVIDPVTGAPDFAATWFVTPKGFRDDADGLVHGRDGQPFALGAEPATGGPEIHMRLTSSGAPQPPAEWGARAPASGPPYLPPQDGYVALYPVANQRLLGTGFLQGEATSLGPPGSTVLRVTVYAPDGAEVQAFDLAPDLVSPASGSVEFPLDRWGTYYIAVEGSVHLASYDLALEQRTPESFEMDFWWEDVRPGHAGLLARNECAETLDGPVMAAYVPPRPDPTSFDWTFAIMTVAGGLVLLVIAVAFVLSAYNHVVARRAVRE